MWILEAMSRDFIPTSGRRRRKWIRWIRRQPALARSPHIAQARAVRIAWKGGWGGDLHATKSPCGQKTRAVACAILQQSYSLHADTSRAILMLDHTQSGPIRNVKNIWRAHAPCRLLGSAARDRGFRHLDDAVGVDVLEDLHGAAGPNDLDQIRLRFRA